MYIKNILLAVVAVAMVFSSVSAVTLPSDVMLFSPGESVQKFRERLSQALGAALPSSGVALPADAAEAFKKTYFGTALSGTRPQHAITGQHWNDWYQGYLASLRPRTR
ncbi:hypothetical protein EX895_003055 [Sporisorium graminicola]|uniref:Uncharacterized protein n=1 Tax=Sporisorium graminicola TaxID=280036 RepID=A0A4V6ETT9_9BASI|nr:hypothetical protein EX895_003055 [Sporisorium graminicola]TKY87959.1 hypothetical protein EX895_003055 [Sporisorium graminicola]